jgi:phosphate:Na+ symporter
LAAVLGGTVVTGILQSSSMVSLMVLAFVGAGVFTLKNALAVILGANLGTTLDSWLVATLGFKTNIEVIAYPAVFIGGLLLITFSKRDVIKYTSYFLLGFGLLFVSLGFMKSAMSEQFSDIDFKHYAALPVIYFLTLGFFITLVVQSSSVTMALTLTAIHVGALSLPSAAALVLGSETGTTIKLVLSGIGGTADKKRVVLGNLLFNVFLTVFAFIFIRQILDLITDVFGVTNPLLQLVSFSSIINLIGVLIFLPFLAQFSNFLQRFFEGTDAAIAAFISNATIDEPQTALDLFRREVRFFIFDCMVFNTENLGMKSTPVLNALEFKEVNLRKNFYIKSSDEKYEFLKLLQGEIQAFYLTLRVKVEAEANRELNQLIAAARHGMYSAKSMHDIHRNIDDLNRSSKDIKYDLLQHRTSQTEALYQKLMTYFTSTSSADVKELQMEYLTIEANYKQELIEFYKDPQAALLQSADYTTAINFNRELFSTNKAIFLAVKDLSLNESVAAEFIE